MMRKVLAITALFLALACRSARADFLYTSFLVPSFNTDYSAWDTFYSAYGSPNKPDFAAPFGIYQSASAAGVTPPANSSPSNPLAYWDPANPTITQVGTNTAFIIGPGTTGNIYSFSAPTSYRLDDDPSYSPGVVLFQFQTEGTLTDFSSITLQYTDGQGHTFTVSPDDMLREFHADTSGIGGLGNRTAVEWNLTGLNVTSFTILWNSAASSNSLQLVSLDTAATYAPVIPAAATWNVGGSGAWSGAMNWSGNALSSENGNVTFANASAATVTLDANHTVGDLAFNTVAGVTINSPGNFTLTANTGIATTALATGTYVINSAYRLGAFDLFEITAGEVQFNGVVSGTYGFEKSGAGTLVLSNNNTFGGSVTVDGGTLRLGGTNSYTGLTTILEGNLIVAANAPASGPGALGNGSDNIVLGEDSDLFANVGGAPASFTIDGDRTVGRSMTLANGTLAKTIAAQNTTNGATYSGNVNISTSTNLHLHAATATDKLTFAGGISGGTNTGSVTLDGKGTVVYSGTALYNYAGTTDILDGTLKVDKNVALSSPVSIAAGAALVVDGTLASGGSLNVSGTIGGSGIIARAFSLASGATVSPGDSPGTLTTGNETWLGGGNYLWQIGSATGVAGTAWDLLSINGTLSIGANSTTPFKLTLQTLDSSGNPGLLASFNPNAPATWLIATTTGGITGFDASDFRIDATGFDNSLSGVFSITSNSGNLYLSYAPVPEPSTIASFVMGCGLLLLASRRKHARGIFKPCGESSPQSKGSIKHSTSGT